MKRKNFLQLVAYVLVLSLVSCDKDLDLDSKLKFSTLTVEQQKTKIEENGLELMESLEKVTETTLFKTMDDFMSANEDLSLPHLYFISTAVARHDAKSLNNLDRQLRIAAEDDSFWGEYVWNADMQEFEKIRSLTNQLIAKFPASVSDTENKAVLTLTYQESTVKVPDTDDLYPSAITCVVTIEGKEALKAEFKGEYKADGTPANASYSMKVDDYKWVASMKNTTKELSEEFEFSYKANTLIKSVASVKGDLTVDKIENSEDVEDVLSYASVYLQVMDVAVLSGVKDVKAFAKEMKALTYSDTKESYQRECDVINKHFIGYGTFVKDKKKFADVEFYVVEVIDYYWDMDYTTYEWVQKEIVYYEFAPRFVLGDGSKVSIEEYFSTGFDNLIQKLLDMLEE
jgi:hypothetical protein